MRIACAFDHAGFPLKSMTIGALDALGHACALRHEIGRTDDGEDGEGEVRDRNGIAPIAFGADAKDHERDRDCGADMGTEEGQLRNRPSLYQR